MILALLLACGGARPAPDLAAAFDDLVVYSGRPPAAMDPVWERARAERGLGVRAESGDPEGLVARAAGEGAWGFADLVLVPEAEWLAPIADLLEPLPADLLDAAGPRFRDPAGRWVGVSGRLRLMVVAPERAPTPPPALAALAEPGWAGRVGWAPANEALHAQLGVLEGAWGLAGANRWVGELVQRGAVALPNNEAVVQAVASGRIDVGLTHHSYLPALRPQGVTQASFATPGDPGNLLLVTAVGVRAGAAHRDRAIELARWLLSADTQRWLADRTFEYPARAGLAPPPGVDPLPEPLLFSGPTDGVRQAGTFRQLMEHLEQR